MTLRKSSGGFTLIELMVVEVIVGVLTLVAYRAYKSFVVKANRAEAKSHLLHVAQRRQLYFNYARAYGTEAELAVTEPVRVTNNYAVAFDRTLTSSVPVFTMKTRPIVRTQQAGDGVLSNNNAGEKLHGVEPW